MPKKLKISLEKVDEINDLLETIIKKYNTIPEIHYSGPKANHSGWSISINGYHLHNKKKDGKAGASISTFTAFENTLKEAIEKFLKLEEACLISKGDNCREGCQYFVDDLY